MPLLRYFDYHLIQINPITDISNVSNNLPLPKLLSSSTAQSLIQYEHKPHCLKEKKKNRFHNSVSAHEINRFQKRHPSLEF